MLLALVVRPLLVGPAAVPIDLSRGERVFVLWSGLKGAVPILLGTYILTDAGAGRRPALRGSWSSWWPSRSSSRAGWCRPWRTALGVPMRTVEPEPWALGMRFRDEPTGLRRYQRRVPARPPTAAPSADLDLGEDAWISMISRDGALVPVRGDTVAAGRRRGAAPGRLPGRDRSRLACSPDLG